MDIVASGIQLKVHQWGEKVSDQIDFEEGALRAVDPSLVPRLSKTRPSTAAADQGEKNDHVVAQEITKALASGEKIVVSSSV